jgi:calcium-translocating P-type ATPase
VHFFAVLLWIASVLAFVAGMPQLAVAIVIVIVVNGLFAFAQEYRAERAAERLRDLLPRRATVIRDGMRVEIDVSELVLDDLVCLSAGDRVSADLTVIEAHGLSIDTSMLTGESVPVPITEDEQVFAGTYVATGEGLALVSATGAATRIADIAALVRRTRRPAAPLAVELNRVVRTIAVIALAFGATFFAVMLMIGIPPATGFLFAIGVTVALVPEGLLPTVTLTLARGAQRMAQRNALVRRLESVETLGSTTFICTDKTGTLTRNEMAVGEVWTPDGSATVHGVGYEPEGTVDADDLAKFALQALALAAARCSTGRAVYRDGAWSAVGDPMEAAIDVFARRLQVDAEEEARRNPTLARFPFDPQRRRMSIVAGENLYVKGAPEALLPLCRNVDGAAARVDAMATRGLRVIAIAERKLETGGVPGSATDAEADLDLLGLIGLEDPPREDVAAAIAACHAAGIRVAMLTGDHPATAETIAQQVGLIETDALVIEGCDLPEDDATLGELLDRSGVVVCRVTPEDKLRIARALRLRGHIVAMTGDGVNDGPALQEANIGIAMGKSGTDVAREAADLVLLDDHFATIVDAIREGRATFENTRRFLTYHLSDNVAELTPFVIWAATGGVFPLALGVLQILALDIVTDALPALALGTEPPSERTLQRPPNQDHLMTGSVLRRAFGVLGPTEALIEMAAFTMTFVALGGWPRDDVTTDSTLLAASGAAFAAVVVGQMANGFACRSTTHWPGALGWTTNRLLVGAVAFQAAALLAFLFFPPLASLLDQGAPTVAGWSVALLAAPAVLAADAAHKRLRRRSRG